MENVLKECQNAIEGARAVVEKYGIETDTEYFNKAPDVTKAQNEEAFCKEVVDFLNNCPLLSKLEITYEAIENAEGNHLRFNGNYDVDTYNVMSSAQFKIAEMLYTALHEENGYFDQKDTKCELPQYFIEANIQDSYYENYVGEDALKEFVATGKISEALGENAVNEAVFQHEQRNRNKSDVER